MSAETGDLDPRDVEIEELRAEVAELREQLEVALRGGRQSW
jgi:hypothetical protein